MYVCVKQNPSFFVVFPSNGGKLSIETTVEKNQIETTISHFSATHTYMNSSMNVVFAPFPSGEEDDINVYGDDM